VDTSHAPLLRRRLPLATLLMVGSAVVVALFPRWSAWLIYDRSAILSGQLWRMFTGHWVHFSTRHLVWDLIPLGLAGWILEARRSPCFGWFCFLSPWAISAALLVLEPQMRFCGGLSGLATAAIALLAVGGLLDAPPWRWVCVAVLLGLFGKTIFELVAGHGLWVNFNDPSVAVSATSHLAGAATAVFFYLLMLVRRSVSTADRGAMTDCQL
jgi:rhomboid family GlyGly-CTERM serine protease